MVRAFYTRAADDRFESAWALAGPGLRRQLRDFDSFRSQLDTLKAVDFGEDRVTSQDGRRATVAIDRLDITYS